MGERSRELTEDEADTAPRRKSGENLEAAMIVGLWAVGTRQRVV